MDGLDDERVGRVFEDDAWAKSLDGNGAWRRALGAAEKERALWEKGLEERALWENKQERAWRTQEIARECQGRQQLG